MRFIPPWIIALTHWVGTFLIYLFWTYPFPTYLATTKFLVYSVTPHKSWLWRVYDGLYCGINKNNKEWKWELTGCRLKPLSPCDAISKNHPPHVRSWFCNTINLYRRMKYFTVLSFNTWKCEGDYVARLESMVTEITSIEPDVILLQEVFVSCNGEWDTAAYLAERLSLNYVFHPARRKKRLVLGNNLESESGLAILAKREIIEHGAIELPTTSKDPSRWLQFAKLGF